jgi:uncharacterized membrane protein
MLVFSSQISRIRGSDSWEMRFNKEALIYFGFSGSILSIAFLTYFMALSSSFVVKIQPIAGTNPLFSIIFTFLFLKEEKMTLYTILGTILVVLGIILITI